MDYLLHILVVLSLYAILAVSLNLLWGYTGLLSFAHAAFFGIGAYTTALLVLHLRWPFVAGAAGAVILTVIIGILLAILTLRLGGDYFILAVLGFQVVVTGVLLNWVDLTRGPFGLYGIPRPTLAGLPVATTAQYLALTAATAVGMALLARRIVASPFGRLLKGIREDEVATLALGKDVVRVKIAIFAVAAAFASVAGSLYAHYFSYIDPFLFHLHESILLVTIVIVGGSGSLAGSLIGVLVLMLFPELLRAFNLPGETSIHIKQILYGLLLFFFMLFRPEGIIREHAVAGRDVRVVAR